MKILHIVKREPDATSMKIMELHKKGNNVTVVNLRKSKDYAKLVDLIFSHDKVISW